jgi:hypothetical protein
MQFKNMASLLKAELVSAEENDDDAHNQNDIAIAAACSFEQINEEASEEDLR